MIKKDLAPYPLLDTKTARVVIQAGGVTAATIEAENAGFCVRFTMATGGSAILSDKLGKHPRHWQDLARAATYLRELGLARFTVDVEKWNPKQKDIAA